MSLALALLLAAGAPANPPQTVTLSLDEYDRLRRLGERPSLTVVDLLEVDGSFARRNLSVVFTGRAAGTLPTSDVLSGEGFRIHTCKGDALLSRGEKGGFALTPLAPRFQLRCKLALDGSDRLEARATRAVLDVAAEVTDGELVASDGGGGERSFSVVRRIAGGQEELPPSVAGRYRVTLLPDETRFLYRLELRNPSRGHSHFNVTLREMEHVESVDAPVAWDADGSGYRFDLPPGETAIALRGRLAGATFVAPVDASLQYLVVEAHPLIRPEVRTAARRVGLGETGIDARYRGAQAFLLGGRAEVGIAATRLEALKTAGFAVNRLSQVFFFAADGKVRGEATFSIDNQGAPALALPAAGEPMFASVAGDPAFLTRDAAGRLFLPLAQGRQDVVVQDVRPFRSRAGLAVARVELPRTGVPASQADVQLRYPAEWIPLYEELAPAGRIGFARPQALVLVGLLLVLAERILALAGLRRRRRLLLAGALALAGALSHVILALGLAASAIVLLALAAVTAVRRLRGAVRVVVIAAGAVMLIVLATALAGLGFLARLESDGATMAASYPKVASESRAAPSADRAEAAAPAPALGREEGESFQGLPARIEIPWGAVRTNFSREMLPSDGPRAVVVVLAASRVIAALSWAALLALLAVAWFLRRDLAEGARRLTARFGGNAAG